MMQAPWNVSTHCWHIDVSMATHCTEKTPPFHSNHVELQSKTFGPTDSTFSFSPFCCNHAHQSLAALQIRPPHQQFLNNTYNVDVPLVLMNSFNTETDTQQIIKKYEKANVRILTFQQKQYPRIRAKDGLPLPTTANPETLDTQEWFPPGHGDVYDAFVSSPLFNQLLSEGKTYLFFSNVDNLGATVDTDILHYLVENNVDFCMEVTPKTTADVKGGTLIQYEKQVKLLEIAQVPKDHIDDFQDISKFTIFNTNNLWANLESVKKNLAKLDEIELIVNNKEHNGVPVVQLETAAGAAIQMFENAIGMVVPRSRFLPVKKTSDLFLVKSNIYTLGENFSLQRDSQRKQEENPIIDLDARFFTNVDDFLQRFADIPDILQLDSLTVRGDVKFEQNVQMGGIVHIENDGEKQMVIRDKKF